MKLALAWGASHLLPCLVWAAPGKWKESWFLKLALTVNNRGTLHTARMLSVTHFSHLSNGDYTRHVFR